MQSASSTAYCKGNYYAGLWQNNGTSSVCNKPLSGLTNVPENSIQVTAIDDRDGNIIGLTLTYIGSPSESYLQLNIYCDRT